MLTEDTRRERDRCAALVRHRLDRTHDRATRALLTRLLNQITTGTPPSAGDAGEKTGENERK